MKLYEGVPGLFIYLYPQAGDLQLFINTSWAICFLFLAGMLCAGNSCQPLGAVFLRAAASDKERPLRIQLESWGHCFVMEKKLEIVHNKKKK